MANSKLFDSMMDNTPSTAVASTSSFDAIMDQAAPTPLRDFGTGFFEITLTKVRPAGEYLWFEGKTINTKTGEDLGITTFCQKFTDTCMTYIGYLLRQAGVDTLRACVEGAKAGTLNPVYIVQSQKEGSEYLNWDANKNNYDELFKAAKGKK